MPRSKIDDGGNEDDPVALFPTISMVTIMSCKLRTYQNPSEEIAGFAYRIRFQVSACDLYQLEDSITIYIYSFVSYERGHGQTNSLQIHLPHSAPMLMWQRSFNGKLNSSPDMEKTFRRKQFYKEWTNTHEGCPLTPEQYTRDREGVRRRGKQDLPQVWEDTRWRSP